MTIKDFLCCDTFQSLISELKNRNIDIIDKAESQKNETVLIRILKNELKERQFLLYGFSCVLPSEEESVEWLLSLLENDSENLKYICARDRFNKATMDEIAEEYPLGEEQDKEDKPTNNKHLGYPETSIAKFLIELDMVKNHPKQLMDYYKRLRIPYATKFTSDMKRLYKNTFA
ncbi:MAG: hypothetical protein FWF85_02990 [Clostridiales bacterium]|jgi:hypothetical protein|nr:hypothetical protein [Clostridiales bacterium]MDR2711922.1 hypothetical protein [Clostridiales bacterium]